MELWAKVLLASLAIIATLVGGLIWLMKALANKALAKQPEEKTPVVPGNGTRKRLIEKEDELEAEKFEGIHREIKRLDDKDTALGKELNTRVSALETGVKELRGKSDRMVREVNAMNVQLVQSCDAMEASAASLRAHVDKVQDMLDETKQNPNQGEKE